MKATFISRENDVVKFSIEFTAEELEKAVIKVYQDTKNQYPVDGFRKGKAPRKMIENKYGADVFKQDALSDLIQQNYPVALDTLALQPIGMPVITQMPEMKDGEDFAIEINVEVYPEIEVKDYKGVNVKKINTRITEKDINAEIENILKRNSRMNIVDRESKEGDTVLIDFKGFDNGVEFEGGAGERYPLVLGSGTFIPGFEEQLIGLKSGDEKDVNVTFPDDYDPKLAGHAVVFKCKVHEVKEEEIPEFDDEFVKDVSEFDTMDEYKASVKEDLKKAAKAKAENDMKNEAIKAVVDGNEFDVPDVMVNDEIEARLEEINQQLSYQGLNLEVYLQYMQKTEAELKEEMRDEAKLAVKTKMTLTAVADQEGLEVGEEELSAELDKVAAQYGMEPDKMRELLGVERMTMLGRDLRMRKAIDFIYDNAEIK